MRTVMPRWIWNRYRFLSVLFLAAALIRAQGPHMEFRNGEFRLVGWAGGSEPPAAGWESVLAVYAGNSETPMLGTYSAEGDALVFRPRFGVAPGVGYHGVFKGGGFVLDPPPQPAPKTHIEHIYPSANV